jgi:rhodanese-related sulfurtransferase
MPVTTTRRLFFPFIVLALALSACNGAESGAPSADDTVVGAPATDATAVQEAAPADATESTVVVEVPAASGPTDPTLFGEGKYAAAADIKAATDSGADIIFVDARTALDYEFGHVPGAINIPYFDAEQLYSILPMDRWIITYCECPHAEAEQVADVMLANGYTMVRVMDEGLQGWRELGGAIEGGAAPAEG